MLVRTLLVSALLAVLLVACGGEENAAPIIRTPTSPPEATQPGGVPNDDDTEVEPPTEEPTPAEPTPTPEVDEDGAIVLPCNDILAPVDKQHRLRSDCVPENLVALPEPYTYGSEQLLIEEAANEFMQMVNAAALDGMYIFARSSYRSYDTQVATYNFHVSNHGQEYADRISARPGHSEHQLGTTTDVTSESASYELDGFRGTPEAAWVAENSWRFGFIVSYPEDKEHITGYMYEPWHIRYVGRDLAADVRASGLTLGEYLHSLR